MEFPLLAQFAEAGVGTYYVVNITESQPSRAMKTVTVVCLWDPVPPAGADPEEIAAHRPGRQTVGRVVADDAVPDPDRPELCRSYVSSLNVEREHQGRMIGCMLLEAAECILYRQARELGCGRCGVEIMVLPDLTASLVTLTGRAARFYYQQGYEFRGTYVHFGDRAVNPKFFKRVGPEACQVRLRDACQRAKTAYAAPGNAAARRAQETELRAIVAVIHRPGEYEKNVLGDETSAAYRDRARGIVLADLRRKQARLFGIDPRSLDPVEEEEEDEEGEVGFLSDDEDDEPPAKRARVSGMGN